MKLSFASFAAAALLFASISLHAAPLDDRIEKLTSQGAAARSLWGVYAIDLKSGDVVANVNGTRLHVPASNRKLVSTAMAASVYEPTDRITTELRCAGAAGGVIQGDIVLKAMGDPSWTPILQNGRSGVVKLRDLAKQAKAAGVTEVTGDVVVDVGRFGEPAPLGAGWIWEDLSENYGSRAAVLSVNHNLIGLNIGPGAVGGPVKAEWTTPAVGIEVENESETGPRGSAPTLALIRDLGGRSVRLTGKLPASSPTAARAVPAGDPVQIWGDVLRYYLEDEGIKVHGDVKLRRNVQSADKVIGSVEGATIQEIMKECNKESDNFLAESLYLLCSAKQYGVGSYKGSRELETKFWNQLGVDPREIEAADGCGLSRENYITPHAFATLLRGFHEVDWFVDTLPVSGHSGTLRYRLSQNGLAGRVHAKTGTLTGVSALSGYVTANSGRIICFSIIANNYTSSTGTTRNTIDDIVEVLASR